MKQCYGYDPTTKAFTGITTAQRNPRKKDEFLQPASATFITPPTYAENQIPVFNEGAQQWVVEEDYRGQLVWDISDPHSQGAMVDWVGPLPGGLTLEDPTELAYPMWYEPGEVWVEDPDKTAEAEAIVARAAEIEAEQEAEGVRDYTPEQVRNYIDNQIDNATTNEEKVDAIKMILKKIAVHVLRSGTMPT